MAGVVAGLSGTFSFICLYKSFTLGPISLMAPTAAIWSAVIPTVVGVLRGEEMSAVNAIGVVLCLLAIVLVSQDQIRPGDGPPLEKTWLVGFGLAALAGTGFSIFFLALAETDPASGLWPLVVARLVSVPVVSVITVVAIGTLVAARGNPRLLVLGGLGEAAANVCAHARLPARPTYGCRRAQCVVSGEHGVARPFHPLRAPHHPPTGRRHDGPRRHPPGCLALTHPTPVLHALDPRFRA